MLFFYFSYGAEGETHCVVCSIKKRPPKATIVLTNLLFSLSQPRATQATQARNNNNDGDDSSDDNVDDKDYNADDANDGKADEDVLKSAPLVHLTSTMPSTGRSSSLLLLVH